MPGGVSSSLEDVLSSSFTLDEYMNSYTYFDYLLSRYLSSNFTCIDSSMIKVYLLYTFHSLKSLKYPKNTLLCFKIKFFIGDPKYLKQNM